MDVHTMFSLSYANYLVLHRTLLQSMPEEWQHRFVAMVQDLERAYAHIDHPPGYTVHVRGEDGRFARDPIPHYNRGRTFIPPRLPGAPDA